MKQLIEKFLRGEVDKEKLKEQFDRETTHAINSHKIMTLTNSCGKISIEELAEQIVESINYEKES